MLPGAPGILLDVGCGTGNLGERLPEWNVRPERYVGVDASEPMLRQGRQKAAASPFPWSLVAAEAERLPFAAASFDNAVSASSLHFWEDPAAGLAEVRRVLRPRGRFLLLDWRGDDPAVGALSAVLRWTGQSEARPLPLKALANAVRAAGFHVGAAKSHRISLVWNLTVLDAVAI